MLLFVVSTLAACRSSGGLNGGRVGLGRYEFEAVEMAIPFRIVLYAESGQRATNAAGAAFARIAALNRSLSDYDAESELSRLSLTSGSGKSVPVSPDLANVLLRAQDLSAASGGAFDVTVGPLTQLWRRARRQGELPDPVLLANARAAVGWTNVLLFPSRKRPDRGFNARYRQASSQFLTSYTARLVVPKMRLDLGAIAKGYALDEATQVLRQHGLNCTLITGAGDMVAGDPPPGETGWKIELAPLDAPNAPPSLTVRLKRAALCTSGDLFQHVEINGVRYSHIVNPHTGLGMTDHSLVVAIGRDGMTTDALSTTISVIGPKKGLRIARQFQAEARVIRIPSGRVEVTATPGFPKNVQ